MRDRITRAVLFSAMLLGLVGCTPQPKKSEPDPRGYEMFLIGRAYNRYCLERGQPPKRLEDLRDALSETPAGRTAYDRLILGEIIFFYGVSFTDMQRQAGASATILAYERQVPKEGGWVLMGDTGVKKVTAAEFAEASKARADGCDTPGNATPTISRPKID